MKKRSLGPIEHQFIEESLLHKYEHSSLFVCRHIASKIQVCIEKYEHPSGAAPELAEEISREMNNHRVLSNLSTFQRAYDMVISDSHTWFISENVEGQNILDYAKSGPIPLPTAKFLFFLLATTTLDLHSKGISVRDWDPTYFICARSVLKFTNFHGLSTIVPVHNSPLSWISDPKWMAPEMLLSSDYMPIQADLWSLGTILYLLITGEPLIKSNLYQTMHKFVLSIPNSVDESAADLLARLLAFDPRKRIDIRSVLNHQFLRPCVPFPTIPTPMNIEKEVGKWLSLFGHNPKRCLSEAQAMIADESTMLFHIFSEAVDSGYTAEKYLEEAAERGPMYVYPNEISQVIANDSRTEEEMGAKKSKKGGNETSERLSKLLELPKSRLQQRGMPTLIYK